MFLHGLGADEYDLLPLGKLLPESVTVISARAPRPYGFGGATWHEIDEQLTPDVPSFLDSLGLLVRFLEELPQVYPVDAGRVFLYGFSMGSAMSLAVSLYRPELVHGVVGLSGFLIETEALPYRWEGIQGKPYFIAHGTADPLVPLAAGHAIAAALRDAGANLTYREYPVAHGISDQEAADAAEWLKERLGKT